MGGRILPHVVAGIAVRWGAGALFLAILTGQPKRVMLCVPKASFNRDCRRRRPGVCCGPIPWDAIEHNTPHTLVVDQKGIVYVGDLGNRRAQVFDAEGNLLKVWTNTGAPWSTCITPRSESNDWVADGAAGRFTKFDLSGNALGAFGKEGKLAGQFGWTHGIACPNENTLDAA
jgi:hypothetical protein